MNCQFYLANKFHFFKFMEDIFCGATDTPLGFEARVGSLICASRRRTWYIKFHYNIKTNTKTKEVIDDCVNYRR